MFTGIIEDVGQITRIEPEGGGMRIRISSAFAEALRPDLSVSVNGCCQTVVDVTDGSFSTIAVEETLAKTTLGGLKDGDPVNLERPLRLDAGLDGHIVQGHVDATGEIVDVESLETSTLYGVAFDQAFAPFVIPAGSIAIDGISLTVARLGGVIAGGRHKLTISIIPHTQERTSVRMWDAGTRVNLEFDMIGKYVARWMEMRGN